jgi:beta-phosphoglucomutase-like phosphatase (HAD superfamily)
MIIVEYLDFPEFCDLQKLPGAPFDAFLFDMDGTLVDSESLHYQSIVKLLENDGCLVKRELNLAQRLYGKPDPIAYKILQDIFPLWERPMESFLKTKKRIILAEDKRYEIFSGLKKLLVDIKAAHIPLAVVTASEQSTAVRIIKDHFPDNFLFIVAREQTQRSKPFADPYLKAKEELKKYNFSHPVNNILIFEDSPTGLASGCSAGFSVARVRWFKAPE